MKKTIIALIPVIVLIGLLAFDISILGSDSIQGASQVALLFASGIAVWLSMWLFKKPWVAFEEALKSNIGNVTSAIVILLLIGAISGAYFGDKISPLSDTTVLASSIAETPLFTHIRYMMVTTVPSFVIALIAFTVIGLCSIPDTPADMGMYTSVISAKFHITPWLLIVPLLTGVMIARKLPAIMVLSLSVVLAVIAAVIFQPEIVQEIGRKAALIHGIEGPLNEWKITLAGTIESIYNSVPLETGHAQVNELVSSRGMIGMLNTIYLIICAMCFGACMRAGGMIEAIMRAMRKFTGNRTGIVASTVGTGTALNTLVCDQYLAIMLTANIFKDIYAIRILVHFKQGKLLLLNIKRSIRMKHANSRCPFVRMTVKEINTTTQGIFCYNGIRVEKQDVLRITLTNSLIVRTRKSNVLLISYIMNLRESGR